MLIFHSKYYSKGYSSTFTPDKAISYMRMILGNDTPFPQIGNENGLTYFINHIYIAPIQNTSFYGILHKTKLYINFIIKFTLNLRHNYD